MSSVVGSEGSAGGSPGWKSTLCQFYIQGNCNKSTEACNFAHGTSDLRTPDGNPIGEEPSTASDKYKSTLCAKFLSIGSCPFGVACRFAHGVIELRKTKNKNNPLYKTTLCKPYSELGFCPNAVNCQFAHGHSELRSKPTDSSFELGNLTPEERHRRLERARNTPGYKTKVCNKFKESNHCEYGEYCHFIHGDDEDSSSPFKNDDNSSNTNHFDATYKTSMCRKIASQEPCDYGLKCRFAHDESEIRKHPTSTSGSSNYHNPLAFKTVLCSNFTDNGQCKYGANCQFAHGSEQLRYHHPIPTHPPYNNVSGSLYHHQGNPAAAAHYGYMNTTTSTQQVPSRDRLLFTMLRSSNIELRDLRTRASSNMKAKRRRLQRLNTKI